MISRVSLEGANRDSRSGISIPVAGTGSYRIVCINEAGTISLYLCRCAVRAVPTLVIVLLQLQHPSFRKCGQVGSRRARRYAALVYGRYGAWTITARADANLFLCSAADEVAPPKLSVMGHLTMTRFCSSFVAAADRICLPCGLGCVAQ